MVTPTILIIVALITSLAPTIAILVEYKLTRRDNDAAAKTVAGKVAAVADKVADIHGVTIAKLDTLEAGQQVIHTLVNSNMTTEMQERLDATKHALVLMKELIRVNKLADHEPSTETLAAVKATEMKIAELEATLADRLTQTKVADAQQGGP